jgi:hypothetical protein
MKAVLQRHTDLCNKAPRNMNRPQAEERLEQLWRVAYLMAQRQRS